MPNLVNLETVTAHVPGDASRVLLDRISLGVESGDRIGVVGLNGGGKTTLLATFSMETVSMILVDGSPTSAGAVTPVFHVSFCSRPRKSTAASCVSKSISSIT